jgi:hypothetical protein
MNQELVSRLFESTTTEKKKVSLQKRMQNYIENIDIISLVQINKQQNDLINLNNKYNK